MAEGLDGGPRRHTRANWVALRTLRQLPKVVGENSSGEPIVEIRSVRLVLREGASHFSRVTTCSKCGREVPGAPVLSPADLDHPPHPVICKDCVRNATAPAVRAVRPPETAPEARVGPGPGSPPDDDRPVPLERRVAELAQLVKNQRADLEAALERRLEDTRVQLRTFATKELARAQEDVDRMMKGVVERVGRAASGTDAGGAQGVEAKLSRELERLSQRVDDQRAELVAHLDARLAQMQATVEDQTRRVDTQLAPSGEATGPGSGEAVGALETRFADLQARLDALARDGAPDGQRLDTLEAQLHELQGGLDRLGEQAAPARLAQLEAQLRGLQRGLDRLAEKAGPERQRLADLEAQLRGLQGGLDRLAQEVGPERQRMAELEAQLGVLQAGIDGIAEQGAPHEPRLDRIEVELQELRAAIDEAREAAGRVDIEAQRLAAIDEHLRQLDERIDGSSTVAERIGEELGARVEQQGELVSRALADTPRIDALEQQLEQAVGRLAAVLEVQEEVRKGLVDVRAAVAAVDVEDDARWKDVEDALARHGAQLDELVDLQTTLDTGLGELRSEIEQVREMADRTARIDTRLGPTVEIPQLPAVEPERGRRGGKKSAEAVAGLSAAVEGLLAERRQVKAELQALANETDTAVKASARASAQAMAIGPLRHDVQALRDDVGAQNEAITALAKTVETLRKAVKEPSAAKPATKATKATKAVKATKATKATKPAKTTRTTKKA